MVKQCFFVWLLLILVIPTTQAASLQAKVDRSVINEGETVILELLQHDDNSEPDISAVAASFEVLSTSRSSQVSITNGSVDSYITWRYTLSPLDNGTVTIPAITAGSARSKPIKVKVNAASAGTGGSALQAVFLEVEVDNAKPYVQSQVIYTVRIFCARDFYDSSLSDPKSDDFVHQRLGDDGNYSVQRNGIRYKVIERRYALFPQKSGKVELPPIVLSATVASGATNQGYLGGLTARGQPVRLRSRTVTLDVQPAASAFSGSWWLPVKSLQLSENWSESVEDLRVGNPVTRTIRVQAQGVLRGQIPTLSIPDVNGLKIYSDQPELDEKATAQGVSGEHTERWAIIPSRPGQYQLPELRITWWNVNSDQQEVAVLPAKTITVLPAENNGQAPVDNTPAQTPQETPVNNNELIDKELIPVAESARKSFGYWPWVVAFLLLGWALTTLGLFYKVRQKPKKDKAPHKKDTQHKALLKKVKVACASGDLSAIKKAILHWATALWPNDPPLNLVELSKRIDDKSLTGILLAVDAAIYSGEQTGAITGLERIPVALLKRQQRVSDRALVRDNPLPEF